MTTDVTVGNRTISGGQNDATVPDVEALTRSNFVPRIEELLKSARAEVSRARKILELLSDVKPPSPPKL
jgi:hypothetical protein